MPHIHYTYFSLQTSHKLFFVYLFWNWKSAVSVETRSAGVEGFGGQAHNLNQDADK